LGRKKKGEALHINDAERKGSRKHIEVVAATLAKIARIFKGVS
jgi:hypothetical protein